MTKKMCGCGRVFIRQFSDSSAKNPTCAGRFTQLLNIELAVLGTSLSTGATVVVPVVTLQAAPNWGSGRGRLASSLRAHARGVVWHKGGGYVVANSAMWAGLANFETQGFASSNGFGGTA
ncbi:MAG TPA: hypothetical protein VLF67_02135 [Candidatus Saccharimonas sp.]|nr:hypothetical protein [Candidatus Saccharimonas sp.]